MKPNNISRRIATVIILLLSVTISYAQPQLTEYYPVGTTWEEVFMRVNYKPDTDYDGEFRRSHFSVDRDTIVDEKRYKMVIQTITEDFIHPENAGTIYKALLREQGDSIFIAGNIIVIREELIYNFNWQESDSILISVRNMYKKEDLTHSCETLLDGNTYECFSFCSNWFNGARKYIYKSIGQTIGGIIYGFADGVRANGRDYLTRFSRNNELIYEKEIPSPQVNAIYDVSYKEKNKRQNCYTLQGVKVDVTKLKSGVYIQNGRKYVVK